MRAFRQACYEELGTARDALFELGDAVFLSPAVSCFAEFSLSPVFRRGWPSVYAALEDGRPDRHGLLEVYVQQLPSQGRILLAGDHTAWPRPSAFTLRDRTVEHHFTKVPGNRPITVGQGYSTIVWIPEERGSWSPAARADHKRPDTVAQGSLSTPFGVPKASYKTDFVVGQRVWVCLLCPADCRHSVRQDPSSASESVCLGSTSSLFGKRTSQGPRGQVQAQRSKHLAYSRRHAGDGPSEVGTSANLSVERSPLPQVTGSLDDRPSGPTVGCSGYPTRSQATLACMGGRRCASSGGGVASVSAPIYRRALVSVCQAKTPLDAPQSQNARAGRALE